jgi:hypothetical protein
MRRAAIGQDTAEDARVERLHPAIEERRKAGQLGDVVRRDAVLAQVRARSAGRVERRAARRERARKLDDARTIVDREERRFALVRARRSYPASAGSATTDARSAPTITEMPGSRIVTP